MGPSLHAPLFILVKVSLQVLDREPSVFKASCPGRFDVKRGFKTLSSVIPVPAQFPLDTC